MATHEKLDKLAQQLEAEGADKLRIAALRSARNFKRSWIEMAEALIRVRDSGSFSKWGYKDFHSYCSTELRLRRTTVDKLSGSFASLKQHAPAVLKNDGIDKPVPTLDAVDYFNRALHHEPQNDQRHKDDYSDEVVEELRHAVFEEGAPVTVLRRRFNPVLFPKNEEAQRSESLKKVSQASTKLLDLVENLDGLSPACRSSLRRALDQLENEVAALSQSEHPAVVAAPSSAARNTR